MTNFAKDTNVPIIHGHDNCHDIAEMSYNKPRWIPVEDRLPDENVKVLLMCKNKAMFVGFLGRYYCDSDELRFLIYTALNSTKLLNKGRVTHWMPLPEPPKEDIK